MYLRRRETLGAVVAMSFTLGSIFALNSAVSRNCPVNGKLRLQGSRSMLGSESAFVTAKMGPESTRQGTTHNFAGSPPEVEIYPRKYSGITCVNINPSDSLSVIARKYG